MWFKLFQSYIIMVSLVVILNFILNLKKSEIMDNFQFDVLSKMVEFISNNSDQENVQLLKKDLAGMILEKVAETEAIPDSGFSLLWLLGVTPKEFHKMSSKSSIVDILSVRMYKKFYDDVFTQTLEIDCVDYIS